MWKSLEYATRKGRDHLPVWVTWLSQPYQCDPPQWKLKGNMRSWDPAISALMWVRWSFSQMVTAVFVPVVVLCAHRDCPLMHTSKPWRHQISSYSVIRHIVFLPLPKHICFLSEVFSLILSGMSSCTKCWCRCEYVCNCDTNSKLFSDFLSLK